MCPCLISSASFNSFYPNDLSFIYLFVAEIKALRVENARLGMMQTISSARDFHTVMFIVDKGSFPETSEFFIETYLIAHRDRTSLDYAASIIAPSTIPEDDTVTTTVEDKKLPVVNLSMFSRSILKDTSDFLVHCWEPTDDLLTDCLKKVVTDDLEGKLADLVGILKKLRNMASFFLKGDGVALPKRMDEISVFQPLVKQLLVHMVTVLMPNSKNISVQPCQGGAHKLKKEITVVATGSTENSQAALKGESDLARVCEGENPRYFELKTVGGALYHSDAWKAKDQALGQTVCLSTAKKENVVAFGALMDLFTVSVIVTAPVKGSPNVVSQMSKRITDARSWVLRVALLLVAPAVSISDLLPACSDDSIIEVHSEDQDAGVGVGVGELNLASKDTAAGCGVTDLSSSSSSSAPNPPAPIEEDTESANDCKWLAREALRARHEEKVRMMLEADALSDGFGFLSKENLDNHGRNATTRPAYPCR